MSDDRDLRFKSATELGKLIRAKEVSSLELTKMYLDALDHRGRELNAVAELTREVALSQARQADEELAAGKPRSVLHGVPWGAKDLLATKDIPTRWGSPAHADQTFDHDAVVVDRLRRSGCVLVAKLAMIELAGGGGYENCGASITGACKCPFDTTRWAGGSSSGSGAAVGNGLVGFAIGSETWGSITVPSAFCNVTGLRPTYGRVPRTGAMALSFTMDKLGPMARSTEDCATILELISGHDPRDPSSTQRSFEYSIEGRRQRDRKLKLGVISHDYERHKAPEAKKRFDEALAVLKKLGHEVGDAKLASAPYATSAGTIVDAEGSAAFADLIRSDKFELLVDPAQKAGLLAGLAIPAADYLRAMQVRTIAGPQALKVFDQFDVLVAPTLLHVAPPADKSLGETFNDMGGNGAAGNLLGWPSISAPMGMGGDDLPLGLELIGAPYDEVTILSLAIAFQRETDHHKRRPRSP